MQGVIVTTTGTRIDVDFNDLSIPLRIKKASFSVEDIISIRLLDDYIEIRVSESPTWSVTHATSFDYLKVQSVNGVVPTSLSDLFDKLKVVIL